MSSLIYYNKIFKTQVTICGWAAHSHRVIQDLDSSSCIQVVQRVTQHPSSSPSEGDKNANGRQVISSLESDAQIA